MVQRTPPLLISHSQVLPSPFFLYIVISWLYAPHTDFGKESVKAAGVAFTSTQTKGHIKVCQLHLKKICAFKVRFFKYVHYLRVMRFGRN